MFRIGIDLGGTNIAAGVVAETNGGDFQLISRAIRKTALPRSAGDIIADIIETARAAATLAELPLRKISGIGLGSPGVVDSKTGVVEYSCNLGFYNVPLSEIISGELALPVCVENDANAAAYGEFLCGSGKGTKDFLMVTLGTGVGGGIIIGGNIYSGYNCGAGELGHMIIRTDGEECACGLKGCAEAYVSASALIRQTQRAMRDNPGSKLWDIARTVECVNGKTPWEARHLGDQTADGLIESYINNLAAAVTSYINIFQPERLALGGGLALRGEELLDPLRERVKVMRYSRASVRNTEIVGAELGGDAGVIGAALLYKQES